MLTYSTIEGLRALRLPAIAAGLIEQREHPDYLSMSFEDRLGLLVDAELIQRANHRIQRSLKTAKLMPGAIVQDIDFISARGLDKATFMSLVDSDWVRYHLNVIIVGPTGVGKSFVACALADSAIREGHSSRNIKLLLKPRKGGNY